MESPHGIKNHKVQETPELHPTSGREKVGRLNFDILADFMQNLHFGRFMAIRGKIIGTTEFA